MEQKKNDDLLVCRLTTEQKKQIMSQAKKYGFTLSDYIRMKLLND